ncbi:Arc family DNA-binding protein [Duganella sp. FT94W]|uniref:Arc family DNA-binding protein n=1 Tax=Duganella lactea TaxID=2692173 RepID=A0ABW9VE12_9BURK|nr:Arc family DNA-binding protein [Duganella lactea]
MSRDIAPFGLRLPSDLKALIEGYARANKRSVNSEIVGRLENSVEATQRPLHSYSDGELIRELMDRYERGMISIRIGPTKEEE